MRGSEFYRKYIEKFGAIASAAEAAPDWRERVERAVRQFHSETMPLMRAPFRALCEDIGAELEAKAQSKPAGRARDAYLLAAQLLRRL